MADQDVNQDEVGGHSTSALLHDRALEAFVALPGPGTDADEETEAPPLPIAVGFYHRGDCDDTCVSSVTNAFQDAELFMGSFYPTRQNVADVPDANELESIGATAPASASFGQHSTLPLAPVAEGEEEDDTAGMSMEEMQLKEKERKGRLAPEVSITDEEVKKQAKDLLGEDTKLLEKVRAFGSPIDLPKSSRNEDTPQQAADTHDSSVDKDTIFKGTIANVETRGENNVTRNTGQPGAFGVGRTYDCEEADVDLADEDLLDPSSKPSVDETERCTMSNLVTATPLPESEHFLQYDELPVATPEDKLPRNTSQNSFIHKYGCPALIGIAIVVVSVAAVVGGLCGSGKCSDESPPLPVTSAPTTYRSSLLSEFETRIREAFGDDYFTLLDEKSLTPVRKQTLEWIVYDDPLQLDLEADNLIQRYILALFYFQTTLNRRWRTCNPPTEPNEADTCYNVISYIEGSTPMESTFPAPSWLSDNHECLWAGIICSGDKRVVELVMLYNDLNGPLPTELAKLTSLKELRLAHHELTGTIPTDLAGLTELTHLVLGPNSFTGTIPPEFFETFLLLQHFSVTRNSLSGTIPSTVQFFPGTDLRFRQNLFTGSLPVELFGLTNLLRLSLEQLDLKGTIATEIGTLIYLNELNLSDTLVSGTIPSEIGRMTSLKALDLTSTNLGGTLPEELFLGLARLQYLRVSNCAFAGQMSSSIGLLTSVFVVNLADNDFSGTIPTEISALTMLQDFVINGNRFTGTFPESVCLNSFQVNSETAQLVADCAPDQETGIPAMECSCCTECCDPGTGICRTV